MAELKTRPTGGEVREFLASVSDATRRKDRQALLKLMKSVAGRPPEMWGPGIVGFGRPHYRYASGREGDWFRIGFSPRKQDLTVYFLTGFEPAAPLMKKLGKHKSGKCCLYFKRLSDIDLRFLEQILAESNRRAGGREA